MCTHPHRPRPTQLSNPGYATVLMSSVNLHFRYKIQSVSSRMCRRVFETATKCMSDGDKSLVADYLNHTNITADKHYRMKQPENILKANRLLAGLAGESRWGMHNVDQLINSFHWQTCFCIVQPRRVLKISGITSVKGTRRRQKRTPPMHPLFWSTSERFNKINNLQTW